MSKSKNKKSALKGGSTSGEVVTPETVYVILLWVHVLVVKHMELKQA